MKCIPLSELSVTYGHTRTGTVYQHRSILLLPEPLTFERLGPAAQWVNTQPVLQAHVAPSLRMAP